MNVGDSSASSWSQGIAVVAALTSQEERGSHRVLHRQEEKVMILMKPSLGKVFVKCSSVEGI